MAKKLIVEETVPVNVRTIVDAEPVGSQVLIEVLKPEEVLNTKFFISGKTDAGPRQGIVLKVGPKTDPEYGYKVGDRVVISGTFMPCPKFKETDRDIGFFEPHCIKGVLVEG